MTLYETRYGRLQYREHKCGIEICGYHGTDIRIDFREIVKALDKPVVAIGKKAFLSCKTIQELILTDDVAEIGDWAFAYCMSLKKVQFLSKEIQFGKEVFKGCSKLEQILISEQIPGELLAAGLVLKMQSQLQLPESEQKWYQQFDEALIKFILMDDREGLVGNVVGGEEEYGTQEQDIQFFMHQKRMEKDLLIEKPIAEVVMHYAKNASESGLDGVVCSPLEAGLVHDTCGKNFLTVTPGVSFADGDIGDQKRVMTPAEAKKIGSDYIVVGRPITAAEDPVAAYERCIREFVD